MTRLFSFLPAERARIRGRGRRHSERGKHTSHHTAPHHQSSPQVMATVVQSWQSSTGLSRNEHKTTGRASAQTRTRSGVEGSTDTGESRRAILQRRGGEGDKSAKLSEKRSSEKNGIRGRQNSLRRVKNSTDMLRERSLHRQRSKKEAAAESNPVAREGRQFTVGNVGNNGMIYLRSVFRGAIWAEHHAFACSLRHIDRSRLTHVS